MHSQHLNSIASYIWGVADEVLRKRKTSVAWVRHIR